MKIQQLLKERDPTRGSIVKNTFLMTTPLWLNTGFWVAIHLLNLVWVSRLGAEAIAAVALGGAGFMLLMGPVQGIVTATYGTVGSFSREDKAGLEKLVKQILSVTWILSILLAILGYFLAPSLMRLLGAEPKVASLGVIYLRICAIGGAFSFSFWPIIGMIRSTRDMFRPMLLMALVLALQGIFDYLFILGNLGFPKLGVAGAGISLALSAGIGAGAGFWLMTSGKIFIQINPKKWQEFKIRFATLKEIIKIAGFDTFEGMARTIMHLLMLWIITPFGTFALAAFAIGERFFRYASMPVMDLGMTNAIAVSNNLGVKDIKRAKKSAWVICWLGALIMGIAGLFLFVFANSIISIFSQDPAVLSIGISYFKITTLGYLFFAAGLISRRAFAGAKDTRTPMIVYFLMMALQISLALILSRFSGLAISGVWISILFGTIFYGLALATLFYKKVF